MPTSGSLTGALALLAAAWAARALGEAIASARRQRRAAEAASLHTGRGGGEDGGGGGGAFGPYSSADGALDAHGRPLGPGRFFARLSTEAVALLAETGAVPHVIIDVRQEQSDARDPAAAAVARAAVRIPPARLHEALTAGDGGAAAGWGDAVASLLPLPPFEEEEEEDAAAAAERPPPPPPAPTPAHTLVFAAATAADARAAACAAAARGFPLTAAVVLPPPPSPGSRRASSFLSGRHLARKRTADISTEALAVLMGLPAAPPPTPPATAGGDGAPLPQPPPPPPPQAPQLPPLPPLPRVVAVFDVRSHEERALEGPGVPDSVHVPAQELASALRLALAPAVQRALVARQRRRRRKGGAGGGDDDDDDDDEAAAAAAAVLSSRPRDEAAWRACYRCALPPLLAQAMMTTAAAADGLAVVFSAGAGRAGRARWCARVAADVAAAAAAAAAAASWEGARATGPPVFLAHCEMGAASEDAGAAEELARLFG
jgi:hypothetical protein